MSLKKKFKDKTPEEIQKILGDAWLNVIIDTSTIHNPLANIPDIIMDDPHLYITWLMMQPDYFSFLCKEILNISITPMQGVILKEMWGRKFPMLVGSRGLGKAIGVNEVVRTQDEWTKIKDLEVGDKVYGSDGKLHNVTGITGLQENLSFYKIKLKDNREIEACEDHMWIVYVGQTSEPSVVNTKELFEIVRKEDRPPIFFPISKQLISETKTCNFECVYSSSYVNSNTLESIKRLEFAPLSERHLFLINLLNGDYNNKSYSHDNEELRNAIINIARSVGIYTTVDKDTIHFSNNDRVEVTSVELIGEKDGMCISVDSDDRSYITKDYIVTHNSFILGLYAVLRGLLMPGRKIVICGAAFRQSKVVYDYAVKVWDNAPILKDIIGTQRSNGPKNLNDMCRLILNESMISALPIGTGEKIRGQRSNDILADEFASIPRDIFENVIAGFGAVSAQPVMNVKAEAQKKLKKLLGLEIIEETEDSYVNLGNQIILSGTAYYDFNHFADYWKKWKKIINSKGDRKKLAELFEKGEIPEDFNWKDYSVMRFPFEVIPKGFMDDAQVARSRATVHNGIYEMEFGSCFSTDSNGFFKRSLIESCNTGNPQQEVVINDEPIYFEPMLKGDPSRRYVYGIDPASEIDNFSIVILEIHGNHRRIVHGWSTNRSEHIEKVSSKLIKETDFYSYCAKKIRELMITFPPERIAIDSQGGGIAVIEALHDPDKFGKDDMPIWEIIEDGKEKPTDGNAGLHIIEKVNFASAEWTSEANHGLRKDFEDKVCLFPAFNAAILSSSVAEDNLSNKKYDTLEDCVMEIEELKNELSIIVITQTANGRDHWDTPEVKTGVGKKGKLRKDRYSALIIANTSARRLHRAPEKINYEGYGGFSGNVTSKESLKGKDFVGSDWLAQGLNGIYD